MKCSNKTLQNLQYFYVKEHPYYIFSLDFRQTLMGFPEEMRDIMSRERRRWVARKWRESFFSVPIQWSSSEHLSAPFM